MHELDINLADLKVKKRTTKKYTKLVEQTH